MLECDDDGDVSSRTSAVKGDERRASRSGLLAAWDGKGFENGESDVLLFSLLQNLDRVRVPVPQI
jgi:hypothetical protein